MNEPIGNEPQEKPNLSTEQEAALKGLVPDFEPKGGDGGGKTQKEPGKESVIIIAVMYSGLFAVLASRLGEHWALSDEEVASLAMPTAAVIEKYLPGTKVGVEVALISAVAMVMLPRVIQTISERPVEGEVIKDGDQSEHRTQES